MNQNLIFARPVVVSEDRLKEALEKQAKQRALREALDQQIIQEDQLKLEARRAKRNKSNKKGKAAGAAKKEAAISSPIGSPPRKLPSPPRSDGGRGQAQPPARSTVEPTRYTMTFREGQGEFVKESPPRTSMALVTRREPVSSTPTPPAPLAHSPSQREANGAVRERRASPSVPHRRVSGEYQTNSLPLDIAGKNDAGGRRGSPKEGRGGGKPVRSASHAQSETNGGGSGSYDTQSLPVDLIYKLGADAAAKAPAGQQLLTPKRSPRQVKQSESSGLANSRSSTPLRVARTPSGDYSRPVLQEGPVGDRHRNAVLSPIGGRVAHGVWRDGRRPSPRTPGLPAGGVLPPIDSRCDSADIISMSAVIDNGAPLTPPLSSPGLGRNPRSQTPTSQQQMQPRGAGNGAVGSSGAGVPPLGDATAQAKKLMEKESGWEKQVKNLKMEMRKTRQKAGKGGKKKTDDAGNLPRRAETAPDPPPRQPSKSPRERADANDSPRARAGGRPSRVARPDFSKAHIFTRENFRPITAPEEAAFLGFSGSPPLRQQLPKLHQVSKLSTEAHKSGVGGEDGDMSTLESSGKHDSSMSNPMAATGNSEESLKLASLTTRQVTLGLPNYGGNAAVPIQFRHLGQFVEEQIITSDQAEKLWQLFSTSVNSSDTSGTAGAASYRKRSSGADPLSGSMLDPDASMDIEVEEVTAIPFTRPDYHQEALLPPSLLPSHGSGQHLTPVLAPALRRKIDQRQSEQEALFNLSKMSNGGVVSQAGGGPTSAISRSDGGGSSSSGGWVAARNSDSSSQGTTPQKTPAAERIGDLSTSHDLASSVLPQRRSITPKSLATLDLEKSGTGVTFDTYSELALPQNGGESSDGDDDVDDD